MEQQSRGRLTIFFSYSRGIGKTHAMLKAAWTAKERGVDTVVGYLAPHAVEKTKELLDGLELLFDPESGEEFPLELALKRRPELILVDGAGPYQPGKLQAQQKVSGCGRTVKVRDRCLYHCQRGKH